MEDYDDNAIDIKKQALVSERQLAVCIATQRMGKPRAPEREHIPLKTLTNEVLSNQISSNRLPGGRKLSKTSDYTGVLKLDAEARSAPPEGTERGGDGEKTKQVTERENEPLVMEMNVRESMVT